MNMDFLKSIFEIPKKFLKKGTSNIGPFTWNLNEGTLGVNPQIGGDDADQLGIIMNGRNDILLRSDTANIDVPLGSIFIDGNTINGLTAISASSAITPTKLFSPGMPKYIYIGIFAAEIEKCIQEYEQETYSKTIKYVYEVYDYDDFAKQNIAQGEEE